MKYAIFAIFLVLASFGTVHSLSCLPECDRSTCSEISCVGSKVPGLCGCCDRCAKQLGDICGNDFTLDGVCEDHLVCGHMNTEYSGSGPPMLMMPSRSGECMRPNGDTCAEVCRTRSATSTVGLSKAAKKALMRGRSNFGDQPFWVYCDCSERQPRNAWMIVQRRSLNIESFDKSIIDYRVGFGFTNADFWLGLDRLNRITENEEHEMMVVVKLKNKDELIKTSFSEFAVGNWSTQYTLHVGASNEYSSINFVDLYNGMAFSANDEDRDNWLNGNCAQMYGGGWWFNKCTEHNLNGRLYKPDPFEIYNDPGLPPPPVEDGPDRISWEPCNNNDVEAAEIWIRPRHSSNIYY